MGEGKPIGKTIFESVDHYKIIEVDTEGIMLNEASIFGEDQNLFINAMYDLIDAMDIADKIYKKQMDPEGAEVIQSLKILRECGAKGLDNYHDAIKVNGTLFEYSTEERIIPDFDEETLRKSYELVNENKSILPLDELTKRLFSNPQEKLLDGRGIYPQELTEKNEKLLEKIKADPEARKSYSQVKIDENGELTTQRFNKVYKEELNEISFKMHNAADRFKEIGEKQNNPGLIIFAEYLKETAEANATLEGDFPYTPADIKLIETYKAKGKVPITTSIAFSSGYPDKKFGLKAFMSGELSIETDECRSLEKLASGLKNMQKLEDNIPDIKARRKNIAEVPVLMQDVIYRSGDNTAGPQGIAVTYLPEEKKVLDENGTVIVGWRNFLIAKGKYIVNPIAKTIFSEEFIQQYEEETFDEVLAIAFTVGVMSHEQRHYIGEQMEREELCNALGGLFNTFNEGKAESGRMYSFDKIINEGYKGLSKEEVVSFCKTTYLTEIFRHIRFGKDNPYRRSAELRLNYFIKEGAIKLNDDLKVSIINQNKFDSAVTSIYRIHTKICRTGDLKQAQEFVDKYNIKKGSKLERQTQEMTKKLDKVIPKDITVQYAI